MCVRTPKKRETGNRWFATKHVMSFCYYKKKKQLLQWTFITRLLSHQESLRGNTFTQGWISLALQSSRRSQIKKWSDSECDCNFQSGCNSSATCSMRVRRRGRRHYRFKCRHGGWCDLIKLHLQNQVLAGWNDICIRAVYSSSTSEWVCALLCLWACASVKKTDTDEEAEGYCTYSCSCMKKKKKYLIQKKKISPWN